MGKQTILKVEDVIPVLVTNGKSELTVTAIGQVSSSGWSGVELRQLATPEPPIDGILDLAFVAVAPEGCLDDSQVHVESSVSLPSPPAWIKGVRVLSSTNSKEVSLLPEPAQHIQAPSEIPPVAHAVVAIPDSPSTPVMSLQERPSHTPTSTLENEEAHAVLVFRDGQLIHESSRERAAQVLEPDDVAEPAAAQTGSTSPAIAAVETPRLEGKVFLKGLLVEDGAECQTLRTAGGLLFALVGELRGFRIGDEVYVAGTAIPHSFCPQGPTVLVDWISRQAPKVR